MFPRESTDFLIISCDDWNRRPIHDVLGVQVLPGCEEDSGRFAPVVMVGGQELTVYVDAIFPVPKEGLVDRHIDLDAKAIADVDDVLDRALTLMPARPLSAMPRPAKYPRAGQIRFADLHIPGERDKPVVVVSSEIYGVDLAFEFVLACRVTSEDIRERTTPGGSAVSTREREEIMEKVRRIVGIA